MQICHALFAFRQEGPPEPSSHLPCSRSNQKMPRGTNILDPSVENSLLVPSSCLFPEYLTLTVLHVYQVTCWIPSPAGRKAQWRLAYLLRSLTDQERVWHSKCSIFLDLVNVSKASCVCKVWETLTYETFYHINVSTPANMKTGRGSLAKVGSRKPWMKMTCEASGCIRIEAVAVRARWPQR